MGVLGRLVENVYICSEHFIDLHNILQFFKFQTDNYFQTLVYLHYLSRPNKINIVDIKFWQYSYILKSTKAILLFSFYSFFVLNWLIIIYIHRQSIPGSTSPKLYPKCLQALSIKWKQSRYTVPCCLCVWNGIWSSWRNNWGGPITWGQIIEEREKCVVRF